MRLIIALISRARSTVARNRLSLVVGDRLPNIDTGIDVRKVPGDALTTVLPEVAVPEFGVLDAVRAKERGGGELLLRWGGEGSAATYAACSPPSVHSRPPLHPPVAQFPLESHPVLAQALTPVR